MRSKFVSVNGPMPRRVRAASGPACAVPVRCGVGVHSSIKIFNFHGSSELAEVEKLRCPQLMLQAGNDPDNTKPRGHVAAALRQRESWGAQCAVEEFPEMKHGWVPRGDLSDAAVRRDVGLAMHRVLAFVAEHLSGSV